MNNKKCTQALEEAMENLEEIKEDVKAYIILAVTDEENSDGTANTGVHAVCGRCRDLCNLVSNLPEDILEGVAMWIMKKGLKGN